jgi:hypothetical protein
MTPRKELFIKVKEALATLTQLELVDLQRSQFSMPKENYPEFFTAALIDIKNIAWDTMVNQRHEGTATIEVIFYCKDGWMDQYNDTADPEHGLIEIDVIDLIAEKLQGLKGDTFRALDLEGEEALGADGEMMSYRLTFSTTIYKIIKTKYLSINLGLE